MPAFVPAAVSWWAALYGGSAVLRTLVAFVHIAGIVGGGGAAVVADRATLRATRKGSLAGRQQIDAIHGTHRIVLIGLTAVIVSGLLLFAADVETYAPSRVFWIKRGWSPRSWSTARCWSGPAAARGPRTSACGERCAGRRASVWRCGS